MDENTTLKIVSPDRDYSKINKPNMETYLSAQAQVEMLKTLIMDPFEDNLKDSTGFSKEKLPKEKQNIEKRIGNHMFYIEVKPTSSPKYGECYNFMNNYLNGLMHGNLEGRKREGVRTTEEGAFVLLEDVLNNFNNSIQESIQPSVEFKIKTSKGSTKRKAEELTKTVLSLDYDRDYSALVSENAKYYIESKKIVKGISDIILNPFQNSVKDASGFTKSNIPLEVKYTKTPVGNVLCYVVSSPADSVSYGKIVSDFMDYIGEIMQHADENQKSGISELRRFDGKVFVKLPVLVEKLSAIKGSYTNNSLRQNVSYLRRPKDDKIMIE
ncbi:MAG: hypothetical protein WC755_05895 [Candidatus Woesearchaeota archaeon]|jgi:hypothetical protein